jgi:CTP synthase
MKMLEEGLDRVVLDQLKLTPKSALNLDHWKSFLEKYKNPKRKVKIGLVGKYVELQDSYKSILEAIIHAGAINEAEVEVVSIHSEFLNQINAQEKLKDLHGLVVAPGFGGRGIEGKIDAISYVREKKIPFFGICLGMQMAVIEYARNVLLHPNANSTEIDENTDYPVIGLMESQKGVVNKGGTMRLGTWNCDLAQGSKVAEVYGKQQITERHRHRFEFNNEYKKEVFEKGTLKVSGVNPETGLVEIVENQDHPWFVGVQFHPEYKSTVSNPHPLFVAFIKASIDYLSQQQPN